MNFEEVRFLEERTSFRTWKFPWRGERAGASDGGPVAGDRLGSRVLRAAAAVATARTAAAVA